MTDVKRSDRFTLATVTGLKIEKAGKIVPFEKVKAIENADITQFLPQYSMIKFAQSGNSTILDRPDGRLTSHSDKKWVLIDADGLVIGRVASIVANILRGKHKPSYTPHVDCGDNVIIINADKVRFAGRKLAQKVYYRHTGEIKSITAGKVLEGRFPERVIEKAVERMIPRGPLGRQQMRSLQIVKGNAPPASVKNAEIINISSRNPKTR
jgi:large subunit ribosomal protein L13